MNSRIKWRMNRLRAMGREEILWRVHEWRVKRKERKLYGAKRYSVIEPGCFRKKRKAEYEKLGLNPSNKAYHVGQDITLLAGFDYQQYKKHWHAGFQTEHTWPLVFAYDISCTGREDIGDVRTNWELNRHFAFAKLAKDYYATGNRTILQELQELFYDWVEKNPFLWGISYTSPMEMAIRAGNWLYMAAFLYYADSRYHTDTAKWRQCIETGCLNMLSYVRQHRARFSSANNHLIVEQWAVLLGALVFGIKSWQTEAMQILTEELSRQNAPDGVNLEMSLHYQTFVMEAYGLLIPALQAAGIAVPAAWYTWLGKMSEFVSDSMLDEYRAIEFGDNDEGKLLDLQGGMMMHYAYVLQLMSMVLPVRYVDQPCWHENVCWLYPSQAREQALNKPLYDNTVSRSYDRGGYTFLKSRNKGVVIAVDHAPLGFGNLAAHGHADALSVQLYIGGKAVFVDGGTGNYHVPRSARLKYRSTAMHNTLQAADMEQSQMLGPFLWGHRAKTQLLPGTTNAAQGVVEAVTQYGQVIHKRKVYMETESTIHITDVAITKENIRLKQQFIIPSGWEIKKEKYGILLADDNWLIHIHNSACRLELLPWEISPRYGAVEDAVKLMFCTESHGGKAKEVDTILRIADRNGD